MNDFMYHTAEAAVVLLGGRSLPQTDIIEARTALKTEGIEGRKRIGNYKRLVVGGSVKNPRKSKESSPLPYLTIR